MEELKNELKNKIKNISFEEMKELLEKTKLPEAREIILNAMEEKDFEKFIEFIG